MKGIKNKIVHSFIHSFYSSKIYTFSNKNAAHNSFVNGFSWKILIDPDFVCARLGSATGHGPRTGHDGLLALFTSRESRDTPHAISLKVISLDSKIIGFDFQPPSIEKFLMRGKPCFPDESWRSWWVRPIRKVSHFNQKSVSSLFFVFL